METPHQQEMGSMHTARSCRPPGAEGLLRLHIPVPVARPQRGGEPAAPAKSPASQGKHFLHSSLCTPQTPPPAQPNPLKGFKGQSVFAVRRGPTMLSLLTRGAGRQRWDRWAMVCGAQAAPVGSTAPAEPRLCAAPRCCCGFSCRNFQQIRPSGWTGRTSLERPRVWSWVLLCNCTLRLHARQMTFLKLLK